MFVLAGIAAILAYAGYKSGIEVFTYISGAIIFSLCAIQF